MLITTRGLCAWPRGASRQTPEACIRAAKRDRRPGPVGSPSRSRPAQRLDDQIAIRPRSGTRTARGWDAALRRDGGPFARRGWVLPARVRWPTPENCPSGFAGLTAATDENSSVSCRSVAGWVSRANLRTRRPSCFQQKVRKRTHNEQWQ